MKKPLRKLTFIGVVFLTTQMSFGQLVNVPLSAAYGGTPHYSNPDKRHLPEYAYNDGFTYNPNNPTSAYPDDDSGHTDNYFLPAKDKDQNYWGCTVAIPAGKTLKHLDLYAKYGVQVSSGAWDRYRNLRITLSDGTNTESQFWEGITPTMSKDANPRNYNQMDFVERGFSTAMLKNATSIRVDQDNDNINTFLEFMEIRLSAGEAILGLDDIKTPSLSVSPNPLQSGDLTIDLTNKRVNKVEVYSMLGVLVFEQTVKGDQVKINHNKFPSLGVYIIKAGNAISKVIIK